MLEQENRSTRRKKNSPCATLSTTNPTCLGWEPTRVPKASGVQLKANATTRPSKISCPSSSVSFSAQMGWAELTGPYTIIWHIQHCTTKGLKNLKNVRTFMISGFRREIDESCALLGHYAASSGNSLPTFRDNLSVPSSRVQNKKRFDQYVVPKRRYGIATVRCIITQKNAVIMTTFPFPCITMLSCNGLYNFLAQNSQQCVCRNKWRFPLDMMNETYRFGGERSAHVQDSYVLCVARRHLACVWCLREVVLIQLRAATDVSRQQ